MENNLREEETNFKEKIEGKKKIPLRSEKLRTTRFHNTQVGPLPPATLFEIEVALEKEWKEISQELPGNLIAVPAPSLSGKPSSVSYNIVLNWKFPCSKSGRRSLKNY
ncbi:hypothetical protein AVEN_33946-1 [Araneus ventricosus]|uniref:Uncharacterized protein n=1 Tax=Araneus ventricosus TaxID=182803 RepID=A0A4Y2K2G8_ARAVE|nr:hypothetical protein AVEN_33946-1 [Araneus ventricosus]